MNFILMLTRGDRTVPNCLEVLQDVLSLGLRHIGFKDIGVGQEEMHALTDSIKSAGAVSYLEVVSEDPESALRSARVARGLGVDRLLGGTEVVATLDILDGSPIGYYPFPGTPFDHPTKLGGDPEKIAKDCSAFMAQGAAGAEGRGEVVARADRHWGAGGQAGQVGPFG